MTDYKKYINALRKCAKEHENDKTFTGHIIVSDLCRDTANLLESLEQEPILDKIRAEIEQEIEQEKHARYVSRYEKIDAVKAEQCSGSIYAYRNVIRFVEKYKAESEKTE